MKVGKLRALAQTGARRVPVYAEIPTVAESGFPGFSVDSWVGLLAPNGTPRPVVERLHAEVRRILDDPEFAARLREQGLIGIGSTPEQFGSVLRTEHEK